MRQFLNSKWVFALAIINGILYVIGAFGLYIHPKHFVGFTFGTLGFPILFLGLVFFFFLYLWINKTQSLVVFLIACIGYKSIGNSFAFNFSAAADTQNSIKVFSWNIGEMDFINPTEDPYIKGLKNNQINSIAMQNADIACITDYSGSLDYSPSYLSKLKRIADSCLGFKYLHIENARNFNFGFKVVKRCYGTLVLSKYPILKTGILKFNLDSIYNEGISFADINVKGKKIRVVVTHLKSLQLKLTNQPVNQFEEANYQDTILTFKTNKQKKLIIYDSVHANQASFVRQFLDTTKLPIIFCADLNSVPTSYTYNLLTQNLKDAFLEKGFGLGRTYNAISPTLRIDVVLVSKNIQVLSYNSPKLPYSDHYPIITTLKLP